MFKKLILFQCVLMSLVFQRIVETKNLKVTDFFFFFFWPLCAACEISGPQPGIKPGLLVVTAWSPYH